MYKKWEGDAGVAVALAQLMENSKRILSWIGVQSWSSPPVCYSFKNVFPNLVILITLDTVQEYCE